jgi:hypothetical protein
MDRFRRTIPASWGPEQYTPVAAHSTFDHIAITQSQGLVQDVFVLSQEIDRIRDGRFDAKYFKVPTEDALPRYYAVFNLSQDFVSTLLTALIVV